MAKIKFENTYELLKYLYLKGILKGYYISGPNDGGSGAYPEILNSEIEGIIDDLFSEHRQICADNGDNYDTIGFELKIKDDELVIIETRSYNDYYDELQGLDLYSDLISILVELKLIEDDNEEVNFECSFKDVNLFVLKKFNADEDDFIEIKVNEKQKESILEDLKESLIRESYVLNDDGSADIDSVCLTINAEDTSYFVEDDSISEDEAKEFIDFMVKYGHFEEQSYEFEEDEIK